MTTYDLDIFQGSSFSLSLRAKDSDDLPINLTDYNVRSYIKEKYTSTGTLGSLVCQVITPESGTISLSLTSTGTEALPVGQFLYDVEGYTTGDNVIKFLRGYVNVYPEVTS